MKIYILFILLIINLTGCAHTYRTFSKDTLYQIEKNPSKHKDLIYAFYGKVISAKETSNSITFQMIVKNEYDTSDFGGSVLTVFYPSGKSTIAKDHEVRVLGKIETEIQGKNLFGAYTTSITMSAFAIDDKTAGYCHLIETEKNKQFFEDWQSGKLFAPTK